MSYRYAARLSFDLNNECSEALSAWCNGGVARPVAKDPERSDLENDLRSLHRLAQQSEMMASTLRTSIVHVLIIKL